MADNPQCAVLNVVGSVINGQYQGLTKIGWVPLGQGVNVSEFIVEYVDGKPTFVGSTFAWFEDPEAWEVVIQEEVDPSDDTTKQHVYIRWDIDLSLVPDLTSVYQVGGNLNGNAFHLCIYMPDAAALRVGLVWIDSGGTNLYYAPSVGDDPGELDPIFTAGTGDLDYGPPELGSDGYVYFVHKETTKKIKRIKADGTDAGVATLVWDSGNTGAAGSQLVHHPNDYIFFGIDTANTKGRINTDGTGLDLWSIAASIEDIDWISDVTAVGRYGFWFNVFNPIADTENTVSRGSTYRSGRVLRSTSRIFSIASTSNALYSCALDLTDFQLVFDFDDVPDANFVNALHIVGIDESGDDPQLYVRASWSAGNPHIVRFNMNDYTDFTDLGSTDTLLGSVADSPDANYACVKLAIKNIF